MIDLRLSTVLATAALLVALLAVPVAKAAAAPVITDSWASTVSAGAADLHATVNPMGEAASARFEYLTAAAYAANLNAVPPRNPFAGATTAPLNYSPLGSGTEAVPFLRRLGGLAAQTAYRWRIVATSVSGPVYGATRTLTTTQNAPVFSLPDNRGWEMVSPVDKNGGEIQGPGEIYGGGLVQAASAGSAVSYSSRTSFGIAASASSASQYVSRRTDSGWLTENVTVPALAGAFGEKPDGVPYRLFSPELAAALLFAPQRCETPPCQQGYLWRQNANGSLAPSPTATDMSLVGATPDLSLAILAKEGNLYRWSGGALTAINLKPGDLAPTPGATLAASLGAVSADGSRIYFSLEGNLYLRQGSSTVQVDEAIGGGGSFETASSNGSVAFFTKAQLDGDHLYRFDASTKAVVDLTPSGDVLGVLGASPDGSHLYYLTPDGLYLRRGASTVKVADSADASNYPPATGAARIAADGTLAFLSSAPLTGFDNNATSQVYRYAPATATLTCASCNPTGSRPLGPSTIPGAEPNGTVPTPYKPRALSADGRRLFFDSFDALVVQDSNKDRDVYQWEAQGTGSCATPGGCVALISSGQATEGALFLDASENGTDVFFLTDASLVVTDPGVMDVYDARIGGGFPAPVIPIACLGDACQVVPGEPEDPTPGTGFYRPEGNLVEPAADKRAAAKRKAAKKRAAQKQAAKNGGRR